MRFEVYEEGISAAGQPEYSAHKVTVVQEEPAQQQAFILLFFKSGMPFWRTEGSFHSYARMMQVEGGPCSGFQFFKMSSSEFKLEGDLNEAVKMCRRYRLISDATSQVIAKQLRESVQEKKCAGLSSGIFGPPPAKIPRTVHDAPKELPKSPPSIVGRG